MRRSRTVSDTVALFVPLALSQMRTDDVLEDSALDAALGSTHLLAHGFPNATVCRDIEDALLEGDILLARFELMRCDRD